MGPTTAVAYLATIDQPKRFARSRNVGPYIGLTPRRYQSGEVDYAGRISNCGDRILRSLLFEAAGVLLFRNKQTSPLKEWGLRLARRVGSAKARVAVARKLEEISITALRCEPLRERSVNSGIAAQLHDSTHTRG